MLDLSAQTPLYAAARERRADAVETLLATTAAAAKAVDPLGVAVFNKDEKVVQLLLDRGVEAIGGPFVFHWAMCGAIQTNQAGMLQRLLTVEGDERKEHWARELYDGSVPILHFAAAFGSAGSVGVLLAAGADERWRDSHGVSASEKVGRRVPASQASPHKNAALRRMLERGPAYRARSRAWPIAAAAVGRGGGGTGKGKGKGGPLGVRWRPRNGNFFAQRFGT